MRKEQKCSLQISNITSKKKMLEQCRSFKYSRVELQLIADCLGAPQWEEGNGWKDIERRTTKAAIETDKLGEIERYFKKYVNLTLEFAMSDLIIQRKEIATAEKIGKLAGDLYSLLSEKNSYRGNYTNAYLEIDGLETIQRLDDPRRIQIALTKDLKLIVDNNHDVINSFESDHAHQTSNGPVVARKFFVEYALKFWEEWKQEKAGKSKQGGRAADYLSKVLNPVDQFLKSKFGLRLSPRAGSKITAETCGNYIMEYYDNAL